MFTGLVEALGFFHRRAGGGVARARIDTSLGPLVLGESICVHGACLTVDRIVSGGFEADMSSETLARTTLGERPEGSRVHLERAVPLGGRMGGHTVLGHVDGVGVVARREASGDAQRVFVRAPAALARYLAPKGSIAIDGVSLTINGVEDEAAREGAGPPGAVHPSVPFPEGGTCLFDVMLVPHTLGRTALGELRPGARVNLEVDVLARYVARQLEVAGPAALGARPFGGAPGAGRGEDRGGERDACRDDDERLLAKLEAGGFT